MIGDVILYGTVAFALCYGLAGVILLAWQRHIDRMNAAEADRHELLARIVELERVRRATEEALAALAGEKP